MKYTKKKKHFPANSPNRNSKKQRKRPRRDSNPLATGFEKLEPRNLLASVSVLGDEIVYLADAGEVNTVTVSETGGVITIQDSTSPITASAEYGVVSPNEVTINAAGFRQLSLSLRDLNDSLDASGVSPIGTLNRAVIQAGSGNDSVIGTQLEDIIIYASGNDSVDSQGAQDQLSITSDLDITIDDSSVTFGAAMISYSNVEIVNLNGGVSNNTIDASATTPASGITGINMHGRGGNDTLIGGDVRVAFSDNEGINSFVGGSATNDAINFNGDVDMFVSDSSTGIGTSVSTHSGIEVVVLNGGDSGNVIDASGVTPSAGFTFIGLFGGDGDDIITGSPLKDQIRNSGGANTIDGGGEYDTFIVQADLDQTLTNTTIEIGGNAGTLANVEDVRLQGGAGDNVLDASAVDDTGAITIVYLQGLQGDDVSIGSSLMDVFNDSEGNNTIIGGTAPVGQRDRWEIRVDADMTATDTTVAHAGDLSNYSGIEDLRLIAGPSDNILDVSAVTAASGVTQFSLVTFAGDDVLRPSGDLAVRTAINGGLGNDTVDTSSFSFTPSITVGIAGSEDGNRGTIDANISFDNIENFLLPQNNVAPEITSVEVSATQIDKGVVGEPVSLIVNFTDSNPGDSHVASIHWGDGTVTTGVVNQTTGEVTGTHSYTTGGVFDVSITVDDGTDSVVESSQAFVSGIRLTNDGILQVIGTDQNDSVHIHRHHDQIHVISRQGHDVQSEWFNKSDVSAIYVLTCDGNDHVHISSRLNIDSIIETGAGNDYVIGGSGDDLIRAGAGNDYIFGGRGNDILLGQAGYDVMFGGRGRDILIGGTGTDLGFGGSGQDIMIGGSTIHDDNTDALFAIRDEWSSSKSITVRKQNILDGTGDNNRLNGSFFLDSASLIDDQKRDFMFGGFGEDWYPEW